jgi:hypothetical protein
MRTFVLAISVIFLLSSNAFSQNKSEDNENFSIGAEIRFLHFGGAPTLIKEIDNIPLGVRQVISHPSDTWIYGSRRPLITIPDKNVDGGILSMIEFGASPEISVWRFRLRSGVNFTISTFGEGPEKANFDTTPAVNQYGQPQRGTGTSLVYYTVRGQNSWKPSLIHEIDFDIGRNFLVIVGYSASNSTIIAESGYDRYDSLEKYKDYELGILRVDKRYLGFGIQPGMEDMARWLTVSFIGGTTELSFNPTVQGNSLTLRQGHPWFFEMGFSAHINSLRKR